MKVLVIGSGAREHCLVDKLSQSPKVSKIYCAPGNGGTAHLAENIEIKADNLDRLLDFALKENVELTVVGPEIPLAKGIVDLFNDQGLKIFGPAKELAKLESSKVFAKEIMKKYGIPTADFKVFSQPKPAKEYIERKGAPVVVKADGLAAGKGVMVCESEAEARQAVDTIMGKKKFGEAGEKIIIEDCLQGQELSLLAFSDGETILPLAASQDHKRIFDNDQGANTGGMGAYAPVPLLDKQNFDKIINEIFQPLIEGLGRENKIYKGILYAGIMIFNNKPNLLEFNVRFGDPEAQVVLPKLKGDLADIMLKTIDGNLKQAKVEWDQRSFVCVVLASGGYPGKYQKGKEISGLEELEKQKDILVYHAGTKRENEKIVTNGGRVLSVVGSGLTLKEAKEKAYQAVDKINFKGVQYRKDISDKAFNKS
ncbi:MAG: phosphoribosylamine--glycine ligase [Candidatus Omnitrophica bacterium]|nr:phosphoribosylamine--glycine ligase [Candidatus Omnitrophota bacterium]MCF7876846.1 phosphoribosylamine--glycine ligase [Candidatus Omnitrophota bacterium]MCF7877895.1 phosphoribosylamine--glycine ligase [Candidatus Omnitrophota bacterium]MCF7893095.1 phosphoribosylamine--glycine ligase [Candidatus Omnitrophota bacterium]